MKDHIKYLILILVAIAMVTVMEVYEKNKKDTTVITIEPKYVTTPAATEQETSSESLSVTAVSETSRTASKITVTETETTTAIEAPLMININTASKEELMMLHSIGEILSEKIIAYRNTNGEFRNIEELMKVNGIGEGIFNEIKGNIFVEFPTYEIEQAESPEAVYEPIPVTEAYPELTLEECSPININTADIDILILLPHVDEHIAEEIIELRNNIGGFSNSYELLYIEDLSRTETAEILEYVTIE